MAAPSIDGMGSPGRSPRPAFPATHTPFSESDEFGSFASAGKAHWASIWLPWILFTIGWIILLGKPRDWAMLGGRVMGRNWAGGGSTKIARLSWLLVLLKGTRAWEEGKCFDF